MLTIAKTLNNAFMALGMGLSSIGVMGSSIINYPTSTNGNLNVKGVVTKRFSGSLTLPIFFYTGVDYDSPIEEVLYIIADSSLGSFDYGGSLDLQADNLLTKTFPVTTSMQESTPYLSNFSFLGLYSGNPSSYRKYIFDFQNCYLTSSLTAFSNYSFAVDCKLEKTLSSSGNSARFNCLLKLTAIELGSAQSDWITDNLAYSISASMPVVDFSSAAYGGDFSCRRVGTVREQNYISGAYGGSESNYANTDSSVLLDCFKQVSIASISDSTNVFVYMPITINFEFSQVVSISDNDSYLKGYNQGKTDGYNIGYKDGENVGYNNGKSEVVDDALEETGFLGLFNAVLGAPSKVIGESLNFELFGINFASLTFTLITISLIVFVISVFLKKV